MTTHPEDAVTRERALEQDQVDAWCRDHLIGKGSIRGAIRAFASHLRALASAQQEPAPSADAEERVDDAEIMRIWREVGLPEYFLGNGGTNTKLVAFAAALRRYAGDGGVWQPIGTAPKDGTPLLLFAYANEAIARTIVVGWWLPSNGEFAGWINATFRGQGGDPAKLRPTHWMPLPAFPAARAKPSEKGRAR